MKIVLASDGSADARAALDLLRTWRPRADDTITVVAVVPPVPVLGAELTSPGPEPAPSLVDAANRIVAGAVASLEQVGHRVMADVRLGNPADEIIGLAEEAKCDLIVVGAKGVGRVRRFLFGSVAHRVAQHAPCSVLVVKPPVASPRSMLVVTDGSPAAMTAAELVVRLPLPRPLHAQIVAVVRSPAPENWGADLAEEPEVAHAWARISRAQEVNAATDARTIGDLLQRAEITVSQTIARGDETVTILAAAKEHQADLVVVGVGRRSMEGEPRLGSLADGLLTNAACSVLIGRARATGA